MIRGIGTIVVLCAIVWFFWMSWMWLRRKDKKDV